MRKALLSSSAAGMWVAFSAVCLAQMSPSFPTPPPLQRPPSVPQNSNAGGDTTTTVNPGTDSSNPPAAVTPPQPTSLPLNSAATLNTMASLDNNNHLNPGDRISYRVIEDRDPAVSLVVTDTGEINVPYLGRFKIQGMTCHEAAVRLKPLLEQDLYKRATVIIGLDVIAGSAQQEVAQDVVWLVGQVRGIGPRPLSKVKPLTVSQVILQAGGFGDFADQRRVRLIHRTPGSAPGDVTADGKSDKEGGQVIDVKAALAGEHVLDPIVQSNDMIIVPKKLVNF